MMDGKETPIAQQHPTIESAATLFGLSTKLAGGAVLVSSLAYLIGWRQLESYYITIGAQWVSYQLSANQILLASMPILMPFFALAVLSISLLLNDPKRTEKFEMWSLILMAIGGASSISTLMPPSIIGLSSKFNVASFGGIALGASAGLRVGELIGRFADTNMSWTSRHISIVYSLLMIGLLSAPPSIGNAEAKRDLSESSTKLAKVKLKSGEDWRLVSLLSGQLLLVKFADNINPTIFGLAQPSDIAYIEEIHK